MASPAEHDLDDARYLLEGRRFHLACFLAQQAAEKALKAFLYSRGADSVWGYSSAGLSNDAQEVDPDFANIAQDASSLDKYYTPTRYPNGLPGGIPAQAYTEADAHLALSTAQRVVDFVRGKLELKWKREGSGGETVSEFLQNRGYKKEKIKELLRRLHQGEEPYRVKEEFRELLQSISPLEIPLIEQELLKEGISTLEIARMCDLHVELFREAVEDAARGLTEKFPLGHPLRTLYEENKVLLRDAEVLSVHALALADSAKRRESSEAVKGLLYDLRTFGSTHYTREEMLLFPYLERRGITAVPSVLWRKHDENREMVKALLGLLEKGEEEESFFQEVAEKTRKVSQAFLDMAFRENNILYPTVGILLSEGEWRAIREQEEIIGYYKVQPGNDWQPKEEPLYPPEVDPTVTPEVLSLLPREIQAVLTEQKLEGDRKKVKRDGDISLDTGYLLPEEISAIFRTLPVDVTFIDREDRVRFFSGGERLFVRTPSVIGRPVQFCHPPGSVHLVNRILQAFKEGKRDRAEFWITMGPKKVYILFLPVRSKSGHYLGTLEVTMDIAHLQEIKDEKRLLDWKD